MDKTAPWRALEAGSNRGTPADGRGSRRPATVFALAVVGIVAAGALALTGLVLTRGGGEVELVSGPASSEVAIEPSASHPCIVVQVAGAVLRPGVYSLPVGSRVGDAITLAGGYSADVDPKLAETSLNLAAKLAEFPARARSSSR